MLPSSAYTITYSPPIEYPIDIELSENEMAKNLKNSALQIDNLRQKIEEFLSGSSASLFLSGIIQEGVDLIDNEELYKTTIYAPFDKIIDLVNRCIVNVWHRSDQPFERWIKETGEANGLKGWPYYNFRKCLDGAYLVDNAYLCVDQVKFNDEERSEVLTLLKENADILQIFQRDNPLPLNRRDFIDLLENPFPEFSKYLIKV